ncbi:ATP-binding protein [Kitasatospora sp. NPDC056327]|uniref:ATP-binding protein n=1 Tax=Kitasatospora sp. NPDC056327 TaxID=3345785 RepID=UPI0035E28E84
MNRSSPAGHGPPGRPGAGGDLDRALRQGGGLAVHGVPPDADPTTAALVRSRLLTAAAAFREAHGPGFSLTVGDRPPAPAPAPATAPTATADGRTAPRFRAVQPLHTFDQLVLPDEVRDRLLLAVDIVELRHEVFEEWGLRRIQPHPGSAVSLHGNPGTGKTMAAHAVAHRLGRPIICARYSELESKYHGEGPQNLTALFRSAEEQRAVLFLDEAESLMSARFEHVGQGSEHAVNAMRSELLVNLDAGTGLVLIAGNLAHSYDRAFAGRVRHVRVPDPDEHARAEIWRRTLVPALPLVGGIAVSALARACEASGREIRNAVVAAATAARRDGRPGVSQEDLLAAVRAERAAVDSAYGRTGPAGPTAGTAATATATADDAADDAAPAATVVSGEEEARLEEAALRALAGRNRPETKEG